MAKPNTHSRFQMATEDSDELDVATYPRPKYECDTERTSDIQPHSSISAASPLSSQRLRWTYSKRGFQALEAQEFSFIIVIETPKALDESVHIILWKSSLKYFQP